MPPACLRIEDVEYLRKMKPYLLLTDLGLTRDESSIDHLSKFKFPYQTVEGPLQITNAGWSMMPDENLYGDMYTSFLEIQEKVDFWKVTEQMFPDQDLDRYLTTIDRFRLQKTVFPNSSADGYTSTRYSNLHTDKTDTSNSLALLFNAGSTYGNGQAKQMKIMNIDRTLEKASRSKDALHYFVSLLKGDSESHFYLNGIREDSQYIGLAEFDEIEVEPGQVLIFNQRVPHFQCTSHKIVKNRPESDHPLQDHTLTYYYKIHFGYCTDLERLSELSLMEQLSRQRLMFGIQHDYQKKLRNRGKNLTEVLNSRLHPKVLEYHTEKGVVPDFDDLMGAIGTNDSPRPSFNWIRENLECSSWIDLADEHLIEKVVKITERVWNFDTSDNDEDKEQHDASVHIEQFDLTSEVEDEERPKKKTKTYEERLNDKLADIDAQIRAHENTIEVLRRQSEDIRSWWEKRPII